MNEFLQMNIFFFITSVAVVVVGALLAWALYYIVRIAKRVEEISKTAVKESNQIVEDIRDIRETVKEKATVDTAARFVGAVFREREKEKEKPHAPPKRRGAK